MMLKLLLLAVIPPTLNYDLGPCFRVISLDGFRAKVLVNVEVRKGSDPPRFVYTYGVINDPQSSQGIFLFYFFPREFSPDSVAYADTLIWPAVWTSSMYVAHGPHPVETLAVWFPQTGNRRVAVRRAPVVADSTIIPPILRRRPEDSMYVVTAGQLEYGINPRDRPFRLIDPGDTLLGMGAVSRLFPAVGTVYMEGDERLPRTCEDTGPPMDSLPYVPPNWAAIVDSFYHLTPYGAGRVQPGVGPGYVFPDNWMQAFPDLQVELERVDSAGWIPDTTVRAYVARALASAEDRVRRGDRVGARAVLEQLMQDLAGYQKGGQLTWEGYLVLYWRVWGLWRRIPAIIGPPPAKGK